MTSGEAGSVLAGEGDSWGWVLPGPSAAPQRCPCRGQGLVPAVTILVGALWQLCPGRRRQGEGSGCSGLCQGLQRMSHSSTLRHIHSLVDFKLQLLFHTLKLSHLRAISCTFSIHYATVLSCPESHEAVTNLS